jgi:hypothetical protein
MLRNVHLKKEKDERKLKKGDLNYFSELGYGNNFEQSYSESNIKNVSNIQFNDAVEKLFFIIQNELESIGNHLLKFI